MTSNFVSIAKAPKNVFGKSLNIDDSRIRVLTNKVAVPKTAKASEGCVLYSMHRDQRVQDNWAMIAAADLAKSKEVPLKVVFGCFDSFGDMSIRQFTFMIEGLKEVETELVSLGVPFEVVVGDPGEEVSKHAAKVEALAVVTDSMPLRRVQAWNNVLARNLDESGVPLYEVDAANIIPVWVASDKAEIGARTLRPKVNRLYSKYLTSFPKLDGSVNPPSTVLPKQVDWKAVLAGLSPSVDRSVGVDVPHKPGKAAGMEVFRKFCDERIKNYSAERNDPNKNGLSGMSPYIRFGQVGFQTLAVAVSKLKASREGVATFIEEGVVRRELSDNFCFYNPLYDSLSGAYPWARESLELHSSDPREYTYSRDELEEAKTHDDLWNAAQLQLVR